MTETMSEWVTANYTELLHIAEKNCKGRLHSEYVDVCHELICELLEMNLDKQIHLLNTNAVKYYFVRMVFLSATSTSSKYQRKYIKPTRLIEFTEDIECKTNAADYNTYNTFYDDVDNIINTKLPWDLKLITTMYIRERKSFAQISKATTIPLASLYTLYKRAKEIIREEYNKLNTEH